MTLSTQGLNNLRGSVTPAFGTDIRTDFIQAMGRVGDSFMILLDAKKVLSAEEMASLQEVRETGKALLSSKE
jgi:chemotaxis signal transduction protein